MVQNTKEDDRAAHFKIKKVKKRLGINNILPVVDIFINSGENRVQFGTD